MKFDLRDPGPSSRNLLNWLISELFGLGAGAFELGHQTLFLPLRQLATGP
jgi:hypothetical protein